MTPLNLLRDLQSEISESVCNFRMISERDQKPIGVYLTISNEQFTHEDLYPLILISLIKVKDYGIEATRPAMSVAEIECTIGIFGEDTESQYDLLNLCEFLRQKLLRDQLIANKYRLQLPMELEILASQPYPFSFGYIKASYSIGRRL